MARLTNAIWDVVPPVVQIEMDEHPSCSFIFAEPSPHIYFVQHGMNPEHRLEFNYYELVSNQVRLPETIVDWLAAVHRYDPRSSR